MLTYKALENCNYAGVKYVQEPQVKIDVTQHNAKEVLIDESFKRPVMVDFWADWCGPCKSLMPILEKLADEYAGAFLLAKVNADAEQMIASQFGVQSLPTVMIMKDGQPIDGFMGAQSEVEVRRLLEKYLPKAWDLQLQEARKHIAAQAYSEALPLLKEAAVASNERADILKAGALAYLELNRLNEAQEWLDKVRMVDQDAEYEQLKAQLELALNAEKAPAISALEAQLEEQPDNEDVQFQLAVQYSQHRYHREALELLFGLLQRKLDARDGEVRSVYTDILAVLGKGDPLAAEFQRKLYALLY